MSRKGAWGIGMSESAALVEEFPEKARHEGESGFTPKIYSPGECLTVDRPLLRTALHPDNIKRFWGDVDPRIHHFKVEGDDLETVQYRIFGWNSPDQKDLLDHEVVVERMAREGGDNPWLPANFEHLVTYGHNMSVSELRNIVLAPGALTTVHQPARPLRSGELGESTNELCVAYILGGGSFKMLRVAHSIGRFPKSFQFLGIRRLC
ncbi:MAG: hypothetical protein V4481_00235 [Patescibacteria group bacterium]